MVPSGPTTGPGVTAPSRCRCHRNVPAVGPPDTDAPLCLASWSAVGHGAQLAWPGAAAGTVSPEAEDVDGPPEPVDPPPVQPAASHPTTAITTTAAVDFSPWCVTAPGSRSSDELLPTVDVVGRACERGVGHDVDGERGDVGGAYDPADRERRAQFVPALLESVAEQGG
jgi:hypothetical protein